MPADIVTTLLSAGPMGAVIVGLAYGLWRQTQALAAVQSARVGDAKKTVETLLGLTETHNKTTQELTIAIIELRNSLKTSGSIEDRR